MESNTEITTTTTSAEIATRGRSIAERAALEVSSQIEASDIAIPRMAVAHSSTRACQDGLVSFGAIFVSTDADDPEPTVLYRPGDEAGVTVYPITMRKGWAFTAEDGNYRTAAFDAVDVPEEAQITYTYVVCVPAFDLELPVSLMLKSTGIPVAQKLNLAIKRTAPSPPWSVAFELSTVARANDRGRWFAPVATSAEPNAVHVAAAERIAVLLGVGTHMREVEYVDPDIDDVPFD
jgi:hypothetical protein